MVDSTISRLNVIIGAQDRATSVIDRITGKLSGLGKQGILMGATFAALNYGLGIVMSSIQRIGEYLGEAVDKFYEFDKAITEVATMLDKTELKYIPELKKGITEISIAFGQSAIDTTRALYQALSAGISVTDSLRFMWEASKLAKAGLASLETTVDVLTTVMNAYGMSASQVSRVSDIMMATVVKGKLRLEDLANSLGYVVPIAAKAGISFEEVSAAMATLTKQGINAQIASRNLRQLISNLIAPSEESKDAMAELGIAYDELTVRARGLGGTLNMIMDATGGSISKMKELIPNIQALNAALALGANNGEIFANSLEYIENALGEVDRKFKEITKSPEFKRSVVQAYIEGQKREIGEMWQPITLEWEKFKIGFMKGGWLA
ncbi:MAG: phage tail tape measure protein, partial [Thermoplasmata archaeon]